MKVLNLSKERRARVWIDERPPVQCLAANQAGIIRNIKIPGRPVPSRRLATIELLIPLGGRFTYGLLGCEASHEEARHLDIVVQTSVENDCIFSDSLARNLDTVWSGIPDEYAKAALDGASTGVDKFGAPAVGMLRFCFGAFGEVGSTEAIFERLGMLAVAMLTFPRLDTPIEKALEELLAQ